MTARVLVACERSGTVRDAFRARGFDAVSCDLSPSDAPGPHITGDVLPLLAQPWDLVIAHPPCTFLANSGVKHLYRLAGNRTVRDAAGQLVVNPDRWRELESGAAFFRACLAANAPRVAVENPIMHSHGRALIGGDRPTQVVQPWMFGHPEKKATGLWLRGLPALVPTDDVRATMATLPRSVTDRIHRVPPGPDRQRIRSVTFAGIAAAMADQWGSLLRTD